MERISYHLESDTAATSGSAYTDSLAAEAYEELLAQSRSRQSDRGNDRRSGAEAGVLRFDEDDAAGERVAGAQTDGSRDGGAFKQSLPPTTDRQADGTSTAGETRETDRYLFNLSPDRAAEMHWRDAVRIDRQALDRALQQFTDTTARERILQHMDDFERRAQLRYLDAHEVADTYREVARLLTDSQRGAALSRDEARTVAEQVLQQAAHPERINQGQHNTCNVATVEARTYTLHPSAAARLVTDIALNGQYRSVLGTSVTLPRPELKPDNEAFNASSNSDASRSYASQLFQQTAVNIFYAGHSFNGQPARYRVSPERGTEQLIGTNGQILTDNPSLQARDLISISNEITGQHENSSDVVITNASGGAFTDVPTATILPSRRSTEPFAIEGPAAVMMVALRIRVVRRGKGR